MNNSTSHMTSASTNVCFDQYEQALRQVLQQGVISTDRTGTGTLACFGVHMRWDLSLGFPAVTTKRLAWRAVVAELLWFLEGSADIRRLSELTHGHAHGNTIWHANVQTASWQQQAEHAADAGRIYGVQWRHWAKPDGTHVDQIAQLVHSLRTDAHSRRHMLLAWNPAELDLMCLPPCHVLSQFWVRNGRLSCQLYQRSADMALGVPFNIASYALLTHLLAQISGYQVGEFIHCIGDAHIYLNHMAGVQQQLSREPLPAPDLWLHPDICSVDQLHPHQIQLNNYQCHPSIAFEFSV